ncbi:MAG TPA: fumarate hydratase [Candidatus Gallimonas intestinavium]|uniref:Fumarate hydratase n=1 Tax=Candidatus Gallimonas intestinavium TaxID=2838603 RepID=A0A9D2JZY2_9FIRM|nr:fumarate hydratase [Candidatus Gallimonas intestinavium]
MRTIDTKQIENCVYRLAGRAGLTLTDSCRAALNSAKERETGAAAFALSALLENEETAQREKMPVCQDTGMAVVLLSLGQDVHLVGAPLKEAVDAGVRRAYEDGKFRKSICDPLTRVNTGDNTPAHLHVEIAEGDRVEITYLPKGFGSENMSRLFMLTPAEGREGIVNAIVETVRLAGSRPCPPVYVGVGIGGCFDSCALLAKKALTRDVGSRNPRADVASIEEEALARINALGIGPQGFGGKTTAIGVSCELAPTHIAGLPVAVNIQCHCVRCEKEVL